MDLNLTSPHLVFRQEVGTHQGTPSMGKGLLVLPGARPGRRPSGGTLAQAMTLHGEMLGKCLLLASRCILLCIQFALIINNVASLS